jgi:hypothetical protein
MTFTEAVDKYLARNPGQTREYAIKIVNYMVRKDMVDID